MATANRQSEPLGHKDVRTTMIYTHVLNRGGRGVRRIPMPRTPLATITLALSLASISVGWAAEPSTDQAKAIAEITQLWGGRVTVDEKGPGSQVISVDFGFPHSRLARENPPVFFGPVTDAGLVHLEGLRQLQSLSLAGVQVTDEGVIHLKGLSRLQSLILRRTNVTDAGLEHIKGLTQLQYLELIGAQVTDAGLENLRGLTRLQKLNLFGTKVTNAGVIGLQKALPNCKIYK